MIEEEVDEVDSEEGTEEDEEVLIEEDEEDTNNRQVDWWRSLSMIELVWLRCW